MKKRVFVLLLTACLLLPCLNGFSVTALDTLTDDSVVTPMPEVSESNNVYNKLHFYFDTEAHATIDSAAELQTATASVKSDFAAATNMAARSGESAEENVYITVQFASDYLEDETYLELKADRENAKNALERDIAKSRQNAYSKSYHQALVTENMQLLSAIPYTDFNVIDYSSFVTLTVPAASLSAQVLEAVAENENILHISLTDGFEFVNDSEMVNSGTVSVSDWNEVLECIGATSIMSQTNEHGIKLYTGAGLKIGVYEAAIDRNSLYLPNLCDSTNENLNDLGARLHFRYASEEGPSGSDRIEFTHATQVTSVLALMLPDANFFFTLVPTDDGNGGVGIEGVSWFIENNCDVVNCSFGAESTTYYRYDIDAVYDYQIYYNDIIVVKPAGNVEGGSTNITSPGYAHNVITVGGAGYSSAEDDWIYYQGARHDNPYGMMKPDIVAPCQFYVPNIDSVGGTSFSAPLVTACIALYHSYFYQNISGYLPTLVARSATISSATKTADYENTCNLDNRVGSGIVNLEAMVQASFYTFNLQNTATYRNVMLNSGETIQIALVWLAEATYETEESEGSKYVADYNLYLRDPSGNTVAISTYTDNSVEYIRYTATTSGNYRIIVSPNNVESGSTEFGLSTYSD